MHSRWRRGNALMAANTALSAWRAITCRSAAGSGSSGPIGWRRRHRAASQALADNVHHTRTQVRRRGVEAVEAVPVPEEPQECLLHDFLGRLSIVDEERRELHELRVVVAEEPSYADRLVDRARSSCRRGASNGDIRGYRRSAGPIGWQESRKISKISLPGWSPAGSGDRRSSGHQFTTTASAPIGFPLGAQESSLICT